MVPIEKGKRQRWYKGEQIVQILQEHAGRVAPTERIRRHGISMDFLCRWRRKYAGVNRAEVQRLRAMEEKNRRLKRLVAQQALSVQVLKDVLGKNVVMTAQRRAVVAEYRSASRSER